MFAARTGSCFPLEPLAQIGIIGHMRQEHLDGDGAIQAGVAGFVPATVTVVAFDGSA